MITILTPACRVKTYRSRTGLIHLAQIRRQDIQLGPVLCHGASGYHDPLFLQHPHDFLIGERFGLVFLFENLRNHVLDAGIRETIPASRLDPRGKEILHLEQTLRRLHVLA